MFSDFRYAFRSLSKTPGFTVVVALSLALGIAANSTVLCWLKGILLNPLPGTARQGEMVILKSNNGGGNISYLDSKDFAALKDVFVDGEVSQLGPIYMENDGKAEWVYSQIASLSFFDVLEAKPILGRCFSAAEDKGYGGNPVVVISEPLWKRRFGGSPDIIGKQIEINRHPFTIIGVMPKDFAGTMTGLYLDCWAPVGMGGEFYNYNRNYLDWRGTRAFHNLFRLKPGVSIEQAQAAVDTLNAQLCKAYPRSNEGVTHQVLTLAQAPYGAAPIMLSALKLMLCVSVLVLLIVSANVANLLLSRAVKRSKEIAIRLASGATRGHLIRLFLAESLSLAVLGGLGGLLLCFWMIDLLHLLLPASDMPLRALSFSIDGTTVGIISILTLATGLVVGLVPALQASRKDLSAALKDGGRASAGSAHHRLRNTLVIAEVALSIILLVCATLCIKGFRKAGSINPGFNTQGVLLARLSIGNHGYDETRGTEFYGRLERALAEIPGVKQVALTSFFPLGLEGCKGTDANPKGRIRPPNEDPTYERSIVSPHFFETLGITLLSGRDFTDADDNKAPHVVIINEAVANRFWPGQNPLGRTLRSHGAENTVIGVVKTIKFYRMNESPRCHLYFPYRQGTPELDLSIALRTEGDPRSYASALRQKLQSLDAGIDIRRTMTLSDHAMAALFAARIASGMLSLMGIVALALAAMGIYAVMAYSVSQRISEFGIRMALGATQGKILQMILRQGMLLASIGIVLGLGASLLLTRLMADFLYGVSPFDPLAFVGVPVILAVIAVAACLIPARRATQADPVEALRAP